MISEPVKQRLSLLHPEGAAHLVSINQLAWQAVDPALLELCSSYIDSVLQDTLWVPPHVLSEREKAFVAFTEQFVTSVSTLTDEQVTRLLQFSGEDEVYSFINALYVLDMTRRVELVAGRLLI